MPLRQVQAAASGSVGRNHVVLSRSGSWCDAADFVT
jgi:hypothetical protein